MSISIVQSAKVSSSSRVTSVDLVLTNNPTAGNLLVVFVGWSVFQEARDCTPPSNWVTVDELTGENVALGVYYYVVQSGDGKNYSFSISGTSDYATGVIYELSGTNTSSPINQHSIVAEASSTSIQTTSCTPDVLNTKALAGATTNDGRTCTEISTGWTLDQSATTSEYHPTFGASRDSLTSDTTTAISNTFTFNDNSGGEVAALVLIAPASVSFKPRIMIF